MDSKRIKLRPPDRRERKQIVAAIAVLKEVRVLELSFELDDDDLTVLSCLSELEIFAFKTRGLTTKGIAQLHKLSKLYALEIEFDSANDVPVAVFEELAGHQRLKFLTLDGPILMPTAAKVADRLPRLYVEIQHPFNVMLGQGPRSDLHPITMLIFEESFVP